MFLIRSHPMESRVMKLIGACLMMASFTVGNPAAGAEASGQFSVTLTALPAPG